MAVAEKKAQETGASSTTSSVLDRIPVVSLIGVVYVIFSLIIVFKLVPDLWVGLIGAANNSGSLFMLQGVIMFAVALGLAVLGGKLLGPRQVPGVRAGIFCGLIFLLVALLLTRWVSLWVEYWSYYDRWFTPTTGIIITCVAGAVILFFAIRWFFKPGFERFLVRFESQGWFTATGYKPQQGQKVRRGTIVGILIIVCSGIYTMSPLSHNTLARLPESWQIGIPFTSVVKNIYANDAKDYLNDHYKGDTPSLGIVVDPSESAARISKVYYDTPAYNAGLTVGDLITKVDGQPVANPTQFNAAVQGKKVDEPVKLTVRREKEETVTVPVVELQKWQTDGVPADDFRKIKDEFNPATHVRIVTPNVIELEDHKPLKNGEPLSRSELEAIKKIDDNKKKLPDAAEARATAIEELKASNPNQQPDESEIRKRMDVRVVPATPPGGTMTMQSLTLLPHIPFTLPILLLALGLWFAWRIVSLPAFADFLIATEAELNKVSWTTRRRLFQDTIVVLATMFLLALLLFGMDMFWTRLLSWKRVGVIYTEDKPAQINKGEKPLW